MTMTPKGPYKLVTANRVPERAKKIAGQLADEVKDSYTIIHAGNIQTIEDVKPIIENTRPDVLFTASMWTPEEAQKIVALAREVMPNLKALAVPQGLHAEKGPEGVLEYVKENLPSIFE